MEGFLVALFLMSFISISNAKMSNKIGIAYGRLGNNLPSPQASIQLIQSINASRVKLYDANPEILHLLSGTRIQVSIMIPNQEISPISANQDYADQWVQRNIIPHYPKTMIRFLLLGNEILSSTSGKDHVQTWVDLVPAMKKIRQSLNKYHLLRIKIGTPLAMDAMETSFPPSNGTFRTDITVPVMKPLLQFLNRSKSYFFLDVYPYLPWSENPSDVDLDYALLSSSANYTYVDPVSGLSYTNLLDQMLDSVVFAMARLGFGNIRLYIAETGWPSAGDIDQIGANIYNAAAYNRNLVERIIGRPTVGTPARPTWGIPTFIFSLFNENQKPGPGTERNWGVMYPDGNPVYEIDLTGGRRNSEYQALPKGNNNAPYEGMVWCVVANEAKNLTDELVSAIAYACGQGHRTCDLIYPGRECYEPVSAVSHANFAFSSFWSQFRSSGASCFFDGLATQTSRDPGQGSCEVPYYGAYGLGEMTWYTNTTAWLLIRFLWWLSS